MNIIFFDGICITCNRFVSLINLWDSQSTIFFCDLHSAKAEEILGKFGTKFDFSTVLFLKNDRIYTKSTAIIEIFRSLGGFFNLAGLLYLCPSPLRDYFYTLFANNRYLFGKKDNVCHFNPRLQKSIIK